jgi:hypothetical protein
MSAACVTTAEFLSWSGTEFVTFGANSTGNIEVASVGAPAATITIGGVVLTAVAGARTSGSDDFSLVTATVGGVAQSIVDCINDPLNSLTAIVTASIRTPGLAFVDLTSVSTGIYSLLPIVTDAAAVYVLSDVTLTGGDEMLVDIITCTCQMLDPTCWGVKRSCAHEYLAAHFITVASGGSGGTVASKSIDKISISYAVTPPSDPDLGSTKWGVLYLALRQSIVRFGAVSGTTGNAWLGVVV